MSDLDNPDVFVRQFVDKDLGVTFHIHKSGDNNVYGGSQFRHDYIVYSDDKEPAYCDMNSARRDCPGKDDTTQCPGHSTRTFEGYLRYQGGRWVPFRKEGNQLPGEFERPEEAAYVVYREMRRESAAVIVNSLLEAVSLLHEDLESRLPALLAKFPEQTEDSIRLLATYDPTDAKYLTWILMLLRREGGGLTSEAGEQLRRHLDRYEVVKRLPDFTGSPDINQYRTFEDFHRQMEASSNLMTKSEQERSYRRLATYQDYTLCQIMTEAAAKKFAQNTSLCFVGDAYARRYIVQEPPLFGVFKEKQPVAALHPVSGQYHDMNNRRLTGALFRAVMKLVRRSGQPQLMAWYDSKLEAAKAELQKARLERYRAQRRALLHADRFVEGVAPLGEYEGYQMSAVRPGNGRVIALLPEDRRAERSPVLTLTDAEGNLVALVDPFGGNAVNGQGQPLDTPMARRARGAFSGFIDDSGESWVKAVKTPGVYKRIFGDIVSNIHDKFMDERTRADGYTDPRSGKHIPPVTPAQAALRWDVFKPRMQRALLLGLPRLRLPSLGMARVMGYQGNEVDLFGEALDFAAADSSVYRMLKATSPRGIVGNLLEMKVGEQEFEVHTEPYQAGWRSVAFLPGGQQKASATCSTREGAEADLAQQLRPPAPQYDPTRTYESGDAVDPTFVKAMQQASAEIFADEQTQMFGGGRPDRRRAVDAYDINCGLCEEWAERVRVLYQEATGNDAVDVLDPGNLSGNADDSLEAGHVFVRFKGMFYDAETPQGLIDWKQLPMFIKQHEDEPSANFTRFSAIIGAENEKNEKKVLTRFKRAVRGYIKWAHEGDEQGASYDEEDLALLKQAQTFAEAEAILAQYESEPSFMYMVRSGYFV